MLDYSLDFSGLNKEFVYFIGTLLLWIATDILVWSRRYLHKKREKKAATLEFNLEKHLKIENQLSEIRHLSGADRVYIAQLHNGVVTAANMHLCKFSITHENCEPGIARVKDVLKNIAIEDHLYLFRLLVDSPYISIFLIEALEQSLSKYLFQSMGTASLYLLPIKNRENSIIAFVGIDFIEKTKLSENKLIELKDQCGIIQLELISF